MSWKRQQWHVFLPRDGGDELVERADFRLGVRPAVVPGQHVGERDAQPELLAAPHHRAKVLRRVLDRPLLGDVVDASLDDQDVRAARRVVEARHDLVRSLPVDAEVSELEASGRPERPSASTGSPRRRRARTS